MYPTLPCCKWQDRNRWSPKITARISGNPPNQWKKIIISCWHDALFSCRSPIPRWSAQTSNVHPLKKWFGYPLVNEHNYGNWPIYSGSTNYQWWYSIAMLVYQRVYLSICRWWLVETNISGHCLVVTISQGWLTAPRSKFKKSAGACVCPEYP